ncbi:MAG TPA: metallophosphoesterase family protein [Gammaproteobacteria bacterium]|nr:metallophosphoesterase family protein [Gammaproteobacteria bacterium]
MKLAVLSDIHGNIPALNAVLEDIARWHPDQIIVNGDLVSRGPYSLDCLRLLQTRFPDARFLTGNHETYVLRCADYPADADSPTCDIDRFADWARLQLGAAVDEIRTWGDHLDLTGLDGGASAHITHGSRLGNRDGISTRTADADLPAKLGEPRDLFVGSHTHKPLLRRFNATLVVNTGSVGQPMDGDARAAYGRFTLHAGVWEAEIMRVAYDNAQAERDFIESGFLAEAGPMAKLIYLELQQSRAHVGPWHRIYIDAIKAREITVADAVEVYLQSA